MFVFGQKLVSWKIGAGLAVFILGVIFFAPVAQANTLLFEENFDHLDGEGEDITVGNTNFDYRRVGNHGGSITAEESNGEVHMRLGGASGGSLNGVGITGTDVTLSGAEVVTLNFRMRMEATNGTIFFGVGDGSMFTGNGIFNTDHLMWGIQVNDGALEYRTGGDGSSPHAWNAFDPPVTLEASTTPGQNNYEFHIIANRSESPVTYNSGAQTVNDGQMHVYLDGDLIGDVPITNNQDAHGFRIYQVQGEIYGRFDSITIYEGAVDPFTPTAVTLTAIGATPAASWPAFLLVLLLAAGITAVSAIVARRRAA